MIFINLTPHDVIIGDRIIEPSGKVARCKETTEGAGVVNGIELIYRDYGPIENLDVPRVNVMYIVSHMVRIAAADRTDVASPGDLIRNDKGQIIFCKNLVVNRGECS